MDSAMSDATYFRKWAAQVARQAGEEPDEAEAQRLLSIAEYWVQLADSEDGHAINLSPSRPDRDS
jgi:hypothetical protein